MGKLIEFHHSCFVGIIVFESDGKEDFRLITGECCKDFLPKMRNWVKGLSCAKGINVKLYSFCSGESESEAFLKLNNSFKKKKRLSGVSLDFPV